MPISSTSDDPVVIVGAARTALEANLAAASAQLKEKGARVEALLRHEHGHRDRADGQSYRTID